jgi:hypothetical protein
MATPRESGKEPKEVETGALEPTSKKKKKKKAGKAVSIRKGNLLFFPTTVPENLKKSERLDPENEPAPI